MNLRHLPPEKEQREKLPTGIVGAHAVY